MDLQSLQKIKKSFVTREVGTELVLVPLTGNVSQMHELFTMNETGRFIWENINDDTTIEDLVKKMVETFEVTPEVAKKDVIFFLERMTTTMS